MVVVDTNQTILVGFKPALALALVALASLAACTPRAPTIPNPNVGKQVDNRPINYTDRTIIFYEPSHGTQIEYFAPSGDAYLWYPGNTRVVAGKYKIDGNNICFLYGKKTYNPVTRQIGGKWNCRPSFTHRFSAQKACSGDPFKLSTGDIPYRLEKGSYTSPQIKSLCDGEV